MFMQCLKLHFSLFCSLSPLVNIEGLSTDTNHKCWSQSVCWNKQLRTNALSFQAKMIIGRVYLTKIINTQLDYMFYEISHHLLYIRQIFMPVCINVVQTKSMTSDDILKLYKQIQNCSSLFDICESESYRLVLTVLVVEA